MCVYFCVCVVCIVCSVCVFCVLCVRVYICMCVLCVCAHVCCVCACVFCVVCVHMCVVRVLCILCVCVCVCNGLARCGRCPSARMAWTDVPALAGNVLDMRHAEPNLHRERLAARLATPEGRGTHNALIASLLDKDPAPPEPAASPRVHQYQARLSNGSLGGPAASGRLWVCFTNDAALVCSHLAVKQAAVCACVHRRNAICALILNFLRRHPWGIAAGSLQRDLLVQNYVQTDHENWQLVFVSALSRGASEHAILEEASQKLKPG